MARPTKQPLRKTRRQAKKAIALSDDEQSDVGDVAMPLRGGPAPLSPSDDADDIDAKNGNDADEKSDAKDNDGKGGEEEDEDEDEDDEDDEDDEGDEDEDDDSDMFVVEAIKKHMVDGKGNLKFQVKWAGYDSKKDLTWEPEENLSISAVEMLEDYFNRVGGRDAIFEETEKAARGKKRGRPSAGAQNAGTKRSRKNGSHPQSTTPPATAQKWTPPSGSWEDEIAYIDACEEDGSGKLVVYLNWKDGQKTKHDTSVIYKKCPQMMLRFYEQHVRIIREENKSLTDSVDT